MSLPNPNYTACFPLQAYFVNKDNGAPLSNGYILFFKDNARTVPKDVFVQEQAPGPTYSYVNIGSQVTLSSVGTTQYLGTDTILFLYPYDANLLLEKYYIEVYSSDNILQFTRENWPPNITESSNSTAFIESQNIISNPQFAEVLFDTTNGATFNVSGTQTTQIAPDWSIVTTGTGSFTVNQIKLTDVDAPGSPAYALDITSTGVNTPLILNQRITDSPRILEGEYANGFFITKAVSPSDNIPLSLNYVSSLPESTPLSTGLAQIGGFTAASGTSTTVIPKTNTNAPGATGYVDIQLEIPSGAHIQVSCFQVISVENNTEILSYIQESTPRQIDHLFHYYKPELEYKPIPSYLVGWDFPLNPAQWGASQSMSGIGANKSAYIWDQTIAFQSASGGLTANRASTNGLTLTAAVDTQLAIVQYLSAQKAQEILYSPCSVMVSAVASVNQTATVSLWYTTDASLPDVTSPTFSSLIATLDANGKPATFHGNWTEVPRKIGKAQFIIPVASTAPNIPLSGWDAEGAGTGTATYFAIVIGTNTVASGNYVYFQSVSLVSGEIPTIPAPQTLNEVLFDCSYYYQKSFAPGTSPAQNVGIGKGESFGLQFNGSGTTGAMGPIIRFPTPMRAIPTIVSYNPAAANAQIRNLTTGADWSSTTANDVNVYGYYYVGTTAAGSAGGNVSAVNWTADARLGVV